MLLLAVLLLAVAHVGWTAHQRNPTSSSSPTGKAATCLAATAVVWAQTRLQACPQQASSVDDDDNQGILHYNDAPHMVQLSYNLYRLLVFAVVCGIDYNLLHAEAHQRRHAHVAAEAESGMAATQLQSGLHSCFVASSRMNSEER